MRTQVQFLAPKIAMSCGIGHRCNWDLALLWLLCRPSATALIWPLAWEPPYATCAALKRPKKKKKSSQQPNQDALLYPPMISYAFSNKKVLVQDPLLLMLDIHFRSHLIVHFIRTEIVYGRHIAASWQALVGRRLWKYWDSISCFYSQSEFFVCLFVCLFLLGVLAMPEACGHSQARGQTCTTVATRATAVTIPDP